MTNQATDNYFTEHSFNEESLKYVRLDLLTRRMGLQREYDLYKGQAEMFDRLADKSLGDIEACNTEFKLVNEALHEIRLQKKKVS